MISPPSSTSFFMKRRFTISDEHFLFNLWRLSPKYFWKTHKQKNNVAILVDDTDRMLKICPARKENSHLVNSKLKICYKFFFEPSPFRKRHLDRNWQNYLGRPTIRATSKPAQGRRTNSTPQKIREKTKWEHSEQQENNKSVVVWQLNKKVVFRMRPHRRGFIKTSHILHFFTDNETKWQTKWWWRLVS